MARLMLAGLAGLLFFTPACGDDKDDAVKKDLEKLQGEWKLVIRGEEITFKIHGNDYEFIGSETEKGTMKFNPKTKPAQVDFDIKEGNEAGKKQVGIYEVKGNKLRLCVAPAGEKKRPTLFEQSEANMSYLFEFEKVKK